MDEYMLKSGAVIENVEQANMMRFLVSAKPHCSTLYTWDEIGMATLLVDVYEDTIRYCPQNKAWYIWDGRRWARQGEDGVLHDRLQTLLNLLLLYCNEVTEPDEELMENYRKYIKLNRKFTTMKNVLNTLAPTVRLSISEMDNNPYLLNTTREAYDLRTGKVVPNISPYNVTKVTTCALPNALTKTCERWYSFIDEIMSGDKEKAKFLQKALGYSLLGVNREECMFLPYGATTRNGKGTLFAAISKVLGEDYASGAPTDLICEGKNGRMVDFNAPQPVLASLTATRLVFMSESARDVRLDAKNMKTMTGRDILVTRGLYESSFRFVPQFTLWLNTNYLPAVTDDTVFASDRIWVIEFNKHFDASEQDKDLKDIFARPENKPTILKWLVDGCIMYYKEGLNPPKSVRDATNRYRNLHDRVGTFIEDCVDISNVKARTLRGDIYMAYSTWCAKPDKRFKPMSTTSFYRELEIRGFSVRKSHGEYYVIGMQLQNDVNNLLINLTN